ncbi:hypothetical protein NC651_016551 [Populus alba x Populus x berolinensis]|nr:hypothetical protein NC651_016551 [Populus alba x Populus x berolinensis]
MGCLLASIASTYFFYAFTLRECFCMGMFFVEILKRIFIAEVTSSEKHSSKRHATISRYLFLLPNSHSSVGLEMLLFRRLFFK